MSAHDNFNILSQIKIMSKIGRSYLNKQRPQTTTKDDKTPETNKKRLQTTNNRTLTIKLKI